MSPLFKDWFEVMTWAIAAIGGLIAAFKAIYEMQQNRKQRIKELRWRQASVAKTILDEMFSHKQSGNAVLMLDWNEDKRQYQIMDGGNEEISYDEVIAALCKTQLAALNNKERYVRECFDYFFYLLDRIEHNIEIELINFADVESPLQPYVKKINEQQQVYDGFMKAQMYELARKLITRF